MKVRPGLTGVVLAISVALIGLTTTGPALGDEPQPPALPAVGSIDSDGDGVEDRPTAVDAASAAVFLDEPVEDLSSRTESAQLFANPNGTWTQETASGPVRVVDDAGVWHDVDTTVVPVEGGEGLAARYASADVVFSAGGDKTFATVTDDQGNRSGFGWPSVLPEPVVEANTVTYPDAVDNGDLVVQALPTGFSHSVVLREAPTGPLKLPIPLRIPDGELTVKDTGSLVLEADGKKVVTAPQPLMWDAAEGHDGLPANVEPVETAVEASGSGAKEKQTLVLSPDEAWLSDPSTQYPVTVDPSYTSYANGDSWVQNADYTTSQGGSSELRAGTYDAGGHKARSFVKFIGMLADNGGSGQDIVSATFKMRNWYSGSCTASAIRISRITETWSVGDLTWANQPTVTSTGSSTFSPAYGYSASCDADGYQAAWDATAIVQAWANGSTNWGIRVAADNEASNYTWRKYRSSQHGNPDTRPRMAVTYNSYPGTASAPAPAGAVTHGGVKYVNKKTFNVTSVIKDPDGDSVKGLFNVSGPAGSWSNLIGTTVNSGGTSVRSYTLNTDGTYTTTARAQDPAGLISQAYSAATTFVVDTTIPATPTITCTNGYVDGGWYAPRPTTPLDTTVCSFSSSADTAAFEWRLNDGNLMTGSSTGTIAVPAAGEIRVDARAKDKAGNYSSWKRVLWGTSPAPVDGSATTPDVNVGENPATITTTLEHGTNAQLGVQVVVEQDGLIAFEGQSPLQEATVPGSTSEITYILPGLVGGTYSVKVQPRGLLGPAGAWSDSRSFSVDHVLGQTDVTLPAAVGYSPDWTVQEPLAAGETRTIHLGEQGLIPDDPSIDTIQADVRVRGWEDAGSLSFLTPDTSEPTGEAVPFSTAAGDDPLVGVFAQATLDLSISRELTVTNTSGGVVEFSIIPTGFRTVADAPEEEGDESEDEVGEQYDEKLAAQPPQVDLPTTFAVHPFKQRIDDAHMSYTSATPTVHAKGYWTTSDEYLKTFRAYVRVEIQSAVGGKWKTVEIKTGVRRDYRGAKKEKVIAREQCSKESTSWWRARVDVDIIGLSDSPGWTYTRNDMMLPCQP